MPEHVYVTRVTHVLVPDEGTPERAEIAAAVRETVGNDEDAAIIMSGSGSIATWLAYQMDGGDFTQHEGELSDTFVCDEPPWHSKAWRDSRTN